MMLEATKLSIAKKYQFGFLLGNMGYKRYGIEGTMTEKNKKAGRYPKERKFVYEANKDYMKKNNIPFASQRPKLDSLYFKRLEDEKETIKDLCLKKILQEVNN